MEMHLSDRKAKCGYYTSSSKRSNPQHPSRNLLLPYLSRDKSHLIVLSTLNRRKRTCADARIMGKCVCVIDSAEIF